MSCNHHHHGLLLLLLLLLLSSSSSSSLTPNHVLHHAPPSASWRQDYGPGLLKLLLCSPRNTAANSIQQVPYLSSSCVLQFSRVSAETGLRLFFSPPQFRFSSWRDFFFFFSGCASDRDFAFFSRGKIVSSS
jgi:hypothetical protein